MVAAQNERASSTTGLVPFWTVVCLNSRSFVRVADPIDQFTLAHPLHSTHHDSSQVAAACAIGFINDSSTHARANAWSRSITTSATSAQAGFARSRRAHHNLVHPNGNMSSTPAPATPSRTTTTVTGATADTPSKPPKFGTREPVKGLVTSPNPDGLWAMAVHGGAGAITNVSSE